MRFPAHGGGLEWAARRYGLDPDAFLDLSSNVNPLGPPADALEAARNALEQISRYPEPDGAGVKSALAAFLGVELDRIVVGNGSSELIYDLCRLFGPSPVTVVAPAFSEYAAAARAGGAPVEHFTLRADDSFALDTDGLLGQVRKSGVLFLCNPASPTGRLYRHRELLPLVEACAEAGTALLVDESFMGFCEPDEALDASLLTEAGEGLIVFSTTTKLFALPGVRGPGYLVSDPETAFRVGSIAAPWRVNVVAAAAAAASLRDDAYLARTRQCVPIWREELTRGIGGAGTFDVFPSRTNFVLARLLRGGGAALVDRLGRMGILVRNCGSFIGLDEEYIRIAVGKPEATRRLTAALTEALAEKTG